MIAYPRFVSLDTSTLVELCKDFWSEKPSNREDTRRFLRHSKDSGVHFVFTFTHVIELLRHPDDSVVSDRITCLRSFPLIAWLQPYSEEWFPGAPIDLVLRELHAFVHDGAQTWTEIIGKTRNRVFQTGTGEEMFVDDPQLWDGWRKEALRQHQKEVFISSVKRTNVAQITDERVDDLRDSPRRTKAERTQFFNKYVNEMSRQLDRHGDKRLRNKRELAHSFTLDTIRNLEQLEPLVIGDNWEDAILEHFGIPLEFVNANTTVGDVGDLAVHLKQLEILGRNLAPPAALSLRDVPLETLPSQVVERKLGAIQSAAERVSGSDNGDGHLLPLSFYCDAIESDKRTAEFVSQIAKSDNRLAQLLSPILRSGDYRKTSAKLRELEIFC